MVSGHTPPSPDGTHHGYKLGSSAPTEQQLPPPPPRLPEGIVDGQRIREHHSQSSALSIRRQSYSPAPSSMLTLISGPSTQCHLKARYYGSPINSSDQYTAATMSSNYSPSTFTPSRSYQSYDASISSDFGSPVSPMTEHVFPSFENPAIAQSAFLGPPVSPVAEFSSMVQHKAMPASSQWSSSPMFETAEHATLPHDSNSIKPCGSASASTILSPPTQDQPSPALSTSKTPVNSIFDNPFSSYGSQVSTGTIQPTTRSGIAQPIPQQPVMAPHLFTQPYVATPWETHEPFPNLATPQFEHPYRSTIQTQDSLHLAVPTLPPRPGSVPAVPSQNWSAEIPSVSVAATSRKSSTSEITTVSDCPPDLVDDQKSYRVSRFIGNMLPIRVGRSTVQTIQSTAKLPFYLSPWGDNNPITLPNVRKRDLAYAGVAHIGVQALAPSAVTLVDHIVRHTTGYMVEKTAKTGIHKIYGYTPNRRLKQRVGMNSLTLKIKHKLIGEEAELLFLESRVSADRTNCAKGWFCPYLYASGRTPDIARSRDFSIAQLVQPGLVADSSIAPALLSAFAEPTTSIISLCPWESPHPTFPRYRRMAVFLAAISPYRTADAWSQARIPNEARLSFHLFTHVPAFVLPVSSNAPVLAWSPWTLGEMLSSFSPMLSQQFSTKSLTSVKKLDYDPDMAYGDTSFLTRKSKKQSSYAYDASNHCREIQDFVDKIADESLIDLASRPLWRSLAGNGIATIIDSILSSSEAIRAIAAGSPSDLERAGIVMFRY